MLLRSRPVAWLLGVLALVGLTVGGWYVYEWNARLIRVGDVRIDPLAQIDPTRLYEVVVWEHDLYIPGIDQGLRRAAFEAAAAELKELYPNIIVRFEFLEPSISLEQLTQALEAGVGPDIAGLSGGAVLVDRAYQVPVTPYISAEADVDILPSVRKVVAWGEHLWVWPRWVDSVVWLGQAKYLGDLTARPGLAAEELLAHGSTWKSQIAGHPPIAYNGYDVDLFQSIAVASTGRTLLTPTGELAWTQSEIEAVASLLTSMVDSGLASKDVAEVARSRLRRFWDGQAVLVAPVNRVLLHHLLSRLGELTHDTERTAAPIGEARLAVLAAPSLSGQLSGHFGTVASYAVFRRPEHAGDDHTRAVMTVAEHLSHRMAHWEASTLLTVPAYTSGLAGWQRDSGLMQEHADALVTLVQRLVAPPVELQWAKLEAQALEQVIEPALPQLLAGATTAQQFAEDVWRGLQGFLAAHTVPSSTL